MQPIKTAAMEGLYHTSVGAPLAIIGMPDSQKQILLDPIVVPGMLSALAYGSATAKMNGLDAYPADLEPPVEVVYYSYHIMVGIGTLLIGLFALGAVLMGLKKLDTSRWYLWLLMLAMPFPYIATEAGWCVAEVGRQPWITYGLMRTADGVSQNVSAGETVFTLFGFMGLYALIGLVYLWILVRLIGKGPEDEIADIEGASLMPPTSSGVDKPSNGVPAVAGAKGGSH
jgi:cytochrome d ubiquinol oxidase subunit I